jgi:hypothetical protein
VAPFYVAAVFLVGICFAQESVHAAQTDLVASSVSSNDGSTIYKTAVATDKYGFTYVAGEFIGGSLTFGNRIVKHNDPAIADDVSVQSQIFIVKYSPTGIPLWVTKLYGAALNGRLLLADIAVSNSGRVFIAGTTTDRVKFGFAQFTPTGGEAGFVAYLDGDTGTASGGRLFNSGAPGQQSGTYLQSLSIDSSNNLYIAGSIRQNAVFTKPNGNITIPNPVGDDGFIAKLDSLLDTQWVGTFGATDYAIAKRVDVDSSGNVYVVGEYTLTPEFNGIVMGPAGCEDDNDCAAGFISKFSKDGQRQWVKSFGGASSSIWIMDFAVNDAGNSYLVSSTDGIKGNVGSGSIGDLSYNGTPSLLVSFDSNGVAQWLKRADFSKNVLGTYARFTSVDTDRLGNVVSSLEYSLAATLGDRQLSTPKGLHVLLTKYSTKGKLWWSRDLTVQSAVTQYNGFDTPIVTTYREHVILLSRIYGSGIGIDLGSTNVTRPADNRNDLVFARYEANQALQVKARNRTAIVTWSGLAAGSDVPAAKFRVKAIGTNKRCVVAVTRTTCRLRQLTSGAKHIFQIEILDAARKVISTDETSKILIGVQQKTPTVEQNRAYAARELVQLASKGRVRMIVESGGCIVANKTLTATGSYATECRVKFVVAKNGNWPKMTTSFDFFII